MWLTRSRVAVAVLSVGAAFAAAGGPPVAAAPAERDDGASLVGSTCIGPGHLKLTAAPGADGSVRLRLTASGVPNGSRWQGVVFASTVDVSEDSFGEPSEDFARTATDGGWVVRAHLSPRSSDPLVSFTALAFSGRDRTCVVSMRNPRPAYGLSFCASNFAAALIARQRRDDDSIALRFLGGARPTSRWSVEMRVAGAGTAQAVIVQAMAGPRGGLRVRATLQAVDDPRLRVVATGPEGRRCALRLHPATITADRLPAQAVLRSGIRDLRRMAHNP